MKKLGLIFLVLSMSCSVVFAEEGQPILSRAEYTNEGLLKGINYNVWLYRLASFGTSWNDGPKNNIQSIKERAQSSQKNSEELLLGLSKILKNEEPAGSYVVRLFMDLMDITQKHGPLSPRVVKALLSDRGYSSEEEDSLRTMDLKEVDAAVFVFLSDNHNLAKYNLSDIFHFMTFDLLLDFYLSGFSNFNPDVFDEMIKQVISSSNEKIKIYFSNRLYEIAPNSKYFTRRGSELTSVAKTIIALRSRILNSLDPRTRLSIATEKVQAYVLSNDSYEAYFNYKKLESDLLIIERLGGKEALLALSDKIRQIVDLLESIDKEISTELARISMTSGYTSGATKSFISSSYISGSGAVSSRQASGALKSLKILRNNSFEELIDTTEAALSMCEFAVKNDDEEVLKACANDLVATFLAVSQDNDTRSDIRNYLDQAALKVLDLAADYFNPKFFQTSCEEIDLEKIWNRVGSEIKAIEELRVRIPTHYEIANQTEILQGITHFKLVDCANPEYKNILGIENRVIVANTINEQTLTKNFDGLYFGAGFLSYAVEDYYRYRNVLRGAFLVDESTIAACSNISGDELNPKISHTAYQSRITPRSFALFHFLIGLRHRMDETLWAAEHYHYHFDEGESADLDFILTDEEQRFSEFFSEGGSYRRANTIDSQRRMNLLSYFSGLKLPDYQKSICFSNRGNADSGELLNCSLQGDGETVCKEHSLFKATISPKEELQ